jgi:hypothetical protein
MTGNVELYLPAGWAYLFLDDLNDDGSYLDMLNDRDCEGFFTHRDDPFQKGCRCYEFEDSFHTFCHWALVTLGTDTPVDMTSPLFLNWRTKHDATRFGVPASYVLRFTFIPDKTKLHRCDSRRIDCQHYLRWFNSQGIAA